MQKVTEGFGDITDPTGATVGGCFVDVVEALPNCSTPVPFKRILSSWGERDDFSRVWFDLPGPNVVHVVECFDLGPDLFGMTDLLGEGYWSYLSYKEAEGLDEGTIALSLSETLVHELGHHFFGDADTDDVHPDVYSWRGNPHRCIMDYNSDAGHQFPPVGQDPACFCLDAPNHVDGVRSAGDPL